MLSAFTCATAIGNIWSTCLGVNIFRLEWFDTFSDKGVASIFIGNIPLSKASKPLFLPSRSACKF